MFLFFVKGIFEPVLIIIEPNDKNEPYIKVQSYIGVDRKVLLDCNLTVSLNYIPHMFSCGYSRDHHRFKIMTITEEMFESCMQKEEYIKYFMDFLEDKERLFKYLSNIVLYYVANGDDRTYTREDFLTYQDMDKIIDTVVEQLYDITSEYIKRVHLK